MVRLGELQAEIMSRMWARGEPATVREMLEELERVRPISYTTVMTVMDKLFKKGLLHRELDGRAFRYSPVDTREAYGAKLLREALEASSDRVGTFVRFLEQMPPEDAEALRDAFQHIDKRDTR